MIHFGHNTQVLVSVDMTKDSHFFCGQYSIRIFYKLSEPGLIYNVRTTFNKSSAIAYYALWL